jgi:hypothetical protein
MRSRASDLSWNDRFRLASIMPEATRDSYRIAHFTVDKNTVFPDWYTIPSPPGEYVRLLRFGIELMSDEPNNTFLLQEPAERCRGRILLTGLGLGCLVKALLASPKVQSIDCVEHSLEVIELAAPHFNDRRLTIVHGDAWEPDAWGKTLRWDCAFHDIWSVGGVERYPEHIRLRQLYATRVREWQGSYWFDALERAWLTGRRSGWPSDS